MFRFSSIGLLFILLVVCFLSYLPGLSGGFLFDDYPNLSDLGTYGGVVDWETFKSFVLNGFSGPTGRPIALASFLLDDNTWPSRAIFFKRTNLLIHELCGLLLCWATLLLLRLYRYREQESVWIAVLASMIWLLHPYFLSTTLYIVQRMAQLATLFSLAGMIAYLKGRLCLETRPRKAYVLMTLGIGLGMLLATFSKENGVLLPLLIFVMEFCNPSLDKKPIWQWRLLFLWLPSLAIFFMLLRYVNFSENPWPERPFNQIERLLSECRIVSEYLYYLWVPHIEGRGLFQDGYHISKSLFSPISTFFSLVGLLLLLVAAFWARRKWPLFSLAILFFFVGHLTESTVVGLELYFEHRNYLSALFMFVPLSAGLVSLGRRTRPKVAIAAVISIFAMLAFLTWQRAQLWSDSQKLQNYWAMSTPDSPRAQNQIAWYLYNTGRPMEAQKVLESALIRMPDRSLLTSSLLLHKVYAGNANATDFLQTGERLAKQPFDAQAVKGLRTLVEYVVGPANRNNAYLDMSLALIDQLDANAIYNGSPLFIRLMPYLRAQVYAAKHRPQEAESNYFKAMDLYADTDAALMMVVEMANRNYFEESLRLLEYAKKIYHAQPVSTLRKSKNIYDRDFVKLHDEITQALQSGKVSSSVGRAKP